MTVLINRPARSAPVVAIQRAAFWVTFATIVGGALNYVYSLILTHQLPNRDYSIFAAGQSLLLLAGTVAGASAPWAESADGVDGGPAEWDRAGPADGVPAEIGRAHV